MIGRTFGSLSRENFQILYGTYVRPHIEYCAKVWTPYYKKDISCLGKVQRSATKLVRNLKNLPYYETQTAQLILSGISKTPRNSRWNIQNTVITNKENVNRDQFFYCVWNSSLSWTQ